MACSSEIKDSPACISCTLKTRMRNVGSGDYLPELTLPAKAIVTKHGDPLIGTNDSRVVYCNRELAIAVE